MDFRPFNSKLSTGIKRTKIASFEKALKRRDHLVNVSRYFVIYGRVVNSDRFANRSTYWSTSQPDYQERPFGQWVDRSVKNPDLLVNGSTWWPTPYNLRVGYNRVALIQVGLLKFLMMLSSDSNSRVKSSSMASLSRRILKSRMCGAVQETLKSTSLPHL